MDSLVSVHNKTVLSAGWRSGMVKIGLKMDGKNLTGKFVQ